MTSQMDSLRHRRASLTILTSLISPSDPLKREPSVSSTPATARIDLEISSVPKRPLRPTNKSSKGTICQRCPGRRNSSSEGISCHKSEIGRCSTINSTRTYSSSTRECIRTKICTSETLSKLRELAQSSPNPRGPKT